MDRFPPLRHAAAAVLVALLAIVLAPHHVSANNQTFEPLHDAGKFTFRVLWDGRPVLGISHITGLVRRTEVVSPRSGGDPSAVRRSPGITTYEPLVLERRLTHDLEFERWANKVWNFGGGLGSEVSLADFRKDIRIELINESGDVAMAFHVYRCWPSDYVVLGEMDAEGASVPIEVLVLQHEGWERDHALAAP